MDNEKDPDAKGATEDESVIQRIPEIKSDETEGYIGAGREEHSGENAPPGDESLRDQFADNDDVPKD